MSNIVIAYHFLSADGTSYGGYRPAPVGEWEPEIPNPILCRRGYHGSVRILDALSYASGPILQRCEYRGAVRGDDKIVAVSRRALVRADATALLRLFAARCAEAALSLITDPDPRSPAACETARRHALGLAPDQELHAALSAASAAARSAAESAALSAAASAADSAESAARWSAASAQNEWLESACLDLL